MIEAYLMHEKERAAQGIPALPLNPEQTAELCKLLVKPPKGKEKFLLGLLKERVSPGVDPAAKVKAAFLAEIVAGKAKSPLITPKDAVADPRHHARRLQRRPAGRRPQGQGAGRRGRQGALPHHPGL